ncbi:MAG: class I SAM-dependent methyltransferase [Candidatus Abyssobacteria bacterium SURF_17]|uniref:Class I SAM-dependent methyltransferase n=1 Tax=Candidatus Abyssobacteria bacterium SURF_17 TaxID=2093361 RepID=A0A419ERQ2_9BACT|nr:MAG: class I SAM-dependent methyltransferase [Candidatus Abyssubacteria bacterium SURF_17]
MAALNRDAVASLEFNISWKSDIGKHEEQYYAQKVNFWRDVLPVEADDLLSESRGGAGIKLSFSGEDRPAYGHNKVIRLRREQFECPKIDHHVVRPRVGRFYPRGLLKGVDNVFSGNAEPFRIAEAEASSLLADLNHPFTARPFDLSVSARNVRKKAFEIGGAMTDWLGVVTQGPGMQVRWEDKPTDFFSDDPFVRTDENDDRRFYEKPRFVTHLDDQALEHIKSLYGTLLRPGMNVLDLMSSWRSHVPESLRLDSFVGLGLNEKEMRNNPQLTSIAAHDLNEEPALPFDDKSFDAIVCTASVEYLTRPFEVFAECARILKPGGVFVHTFSNRWFPPKVVRIWTELSEFERMGLVLEYFLRTGRYESLETRSIRGWPRPVSDQYYPRVRISDPVYAVFGRRSAG